MERHVGITREQTAAEARKAEEWAAIERDEAKRALMSEFYAVWLERIVALVAGIFVPHMFGCFRNGYDPTDGALVGYVMAFGIPIFSWITTEGDLRWAERRARVLFD